MRSIRPNDDDEDVEVEEEEQDWRASRTSCRKSRRGERQQQCTYSPLLARRRLIIGNVFLTSPILSILVIHHQNAISIFASEYNRFRLVSSFCRRTMMACRCQQRRQQQWRLILPGLRADALLRQPTTGTSCGRSCSCCRHGRRRDRRINLHLNPAR